MIWVSSVIICYQTTTKQHSPKWSHGWFWVCYVDIFTLNCKPTQVMDTQRTFHSKHKNRYPFLCVLIKLSTFAHCQGTLDIFGNPQIFTWAPGNIQRNLTGMEMCLSSTIWCVLKLIMNQAWSCLIMHYFCMDTKVHVWSKRRVYFSDVFTAHTVFLVGMPFEVVISEDM